MELDYKEMFESLLKAFDKQCELQEDFFNLLNQQQKLQPYGTKAIDGFNKLSLIERNALLRRLIAFNLTAKGICETHNWEIESNE